MRSYVIVTYVALAVISLLVIDVDANWDEATGFVHGYKPSPAWLGSHKRTAPNPSQEENSGELTSVSLFLFTNM